MCSKENPVHPVHPVHGGGGDVEELRRMALEALRTPGSGPALAWAAYSRGESSAFQYVVRAVAEFWHDGARWERWHVPVTLAVGELGEGP